MYLFVSVCLSVPSGFRFHFLIQTATYVDNSKKDNQHKYKHLKKKIYTKICPQKSRLGQSVKNLEGYLPTSTSAYDVEKQQDPWLPILWNLLIDFYNDICHHTVSRRRRLVTVDIFKIYLFVERTAS